MSEKPRIKFKSFILLPIFMAFFGLIVIATILIYRLQQVHMEDDVHARLESVQEITKTHVADISQTLSDRDITLRLAYILIPVGIFTWIAFSLPAVMVNYGYIFSVLSDPLGLGWDLFNTADLHFKPILPEWIPVI